MNFRYQRRIAASLLKCGVNRVIIRDIPGEVENIQNAITRELVRALIRRRVIAARPVKGVSRGRTRKRAAQRAKGRRRGPGSRAGAQKARTPKKEAWMRTIRPLRSLLRELRGEGRIDAATYRRFYLQAKGGMFRSRAHLEQQLRAGGHLKEGEG